MPRQEAIELGNHMAKRAWIDYERTLDQKYADRAEWWRETIERYIAREL